MQLIIKKGDVHGNLLCKNWKMFVAVNHVNTKQLGERHPVSRVSGSHLPTVWCICLIRWWLIYAPKMELHFILFFSNSKFNKTQSRRRPNLHWCLVAFAHLLCLSCSTTSIQASRLAGILRGCLNERKHQVWNKTQETGLTAAPPSHHSDFFSPQLSLVNGINYSNFFLFSSPPRTANKSFPVLLRLRAALINITSYKIITALYCLQRKQHQKLTGCRVGFRRAI